MMPTLQCVRGLLTKVATPHLNGAESILMTRDQYNVVGGASAVVFAIVSLLALACKTRLPAGWDANIVGGFLIAVWAIVPPAFFWLDWVYFCRDMSPADRGIVGHTHDLARNIWVGLLGVLTFGFFKLSL
jgi:hypothetical protein